MAQLQLIGSPALIVDMLAILAVDGATARDAIASLLWPDVPLKTANTSLRQRVFRLRRRCGSDLVLTGPQLQLDVGVSHDVAMSSRVDIEALPGGDLLGSFSYADCDALGDWVRAARERWRGWRRDALAGAAARHESAGELARAIELAQRLVIDDPLAEHAQRRLMRLHYLRGDRAAAISVFEECERRLKEDLGSRPDPETIELLNTIEHASVVGVSRRAVVPASLRRPPRMIGRNLELMSLDRAWSADRVFLLLGEAGLGKTRLLQEFSTSQAQALHTQARPGDTVVPFALLARLLRAVHEAVGEAALPTDASARRELARVLPELGAGVAIAGEAQRLLLQRAVETLLSQGLARGATAFLIDDLHFADAASLDMLQVLVVSERLAALRWGFAQRPGEGGPPSEALMRALEETQRLQRVPLAPLDVCQMQALIESLRLPEIDAAHWAAPLVRHTGGNPLFALETLKDMVLAGVQGDCGQPLPQPVTVGTLIERRLRQLSASALALARIAAVAGVDFSIELAEHVLRTPALALADAWSELESAQVLHGPAFAHDLVYEAALGSVPAEIARHAHAAIAAYLDPLGADPARLAAHWKAGGQPLRCARALMDAAMRAQATGRVREAFEFLCDAVSAFREGGDPSAAFDAMVEAQPAALTALGPDELRDWARRVVAAARGPQQRARGLCVQATIANQLGDTAIALAASEEALSIATGVGDPVAALRAARAVAVARLAAGDAAAALSAIEPHIDAAERIEDRSARAELLTDYALLLERTDRRDEAVALYDRATHLAREANNLIAAQVAMANAAVSCVYLGKLGEALARNERAVQLASEMESDSISIAIDRINRGGMLIEAGRFGEALGLLEAASLVVEEARAMSWRLMATQHLSCLWAALGQPGRALLIASRLPEPDAPVPQTLWHGLQLRVRRWTGESLDPHREALTQRLAAVPLLTRQRLPMEIELCRSLPPADASLRLRRLAIEARAKRQFAFACTADGLCISALLRAGEVGMAADLSARWLGERRTVDPYDAYLPELLHAAASALSAVGDVVAAVAVIEDADCWISSAARLLLPEMRESFLNRNPVNRELRELASRARRQQVTGE